MNKTDFYSTLREDAASRLDNSRRMLADVGVSYDTLREVFENCFDIFEGYILYYKNPVVRRGLAKLGVRKTGIDEIRAFLTEKGIVRISDSAPLTDAHISSLMNVARRSKGLVKTRKVLPPANPVAAIREQLGGRPSGVLPSRSVTPRPEVVAISQPKGVVTPPAQPVSFNFQNAMRRLVSEQKNQFKGVRLVDEDVWFLNTVVEQEWKELKQFGHYGKKFWDVIEIAKWSENSVRYALTALKAKLIHLNVFDDYKNID
ncbi:hypothetical protein NLY09_08985 (plasmid) [Burkholderia vietnamiensis]